MLKQKRKIHSSLECQSCHRLRISCNNNLPCDRCVDKGRPDLCSYETDVAAYSSNLVNSTTSHRIQTEKGQTRSTDLRSGRSVSTGSTEWKRLQEELRYLRAQDQKLTMLQRLIHAQDWSALATFNSLQPGQDGRPSKPLSEIGCTSSTNTADKSLPRREVTGLAPHEPCTPSYLPSSYNSGTESYTVRNKQSPFAIPSALPSRSVSESVDGMTTPRDPYTWRGSQLVHASPTPSLTLTHSSSESAATRRMLWATATGVTNIDQTPTQMLQWPLDTIDQDQGMLGNEQTMISDASESVTHHLGLHWTESYLPDISMTSTYHPYLDPDPGPDLDLNLASEFLIHPPMVVPEWRTPQLSPSISYKRISVVIPDLSSHASGPNIQSTQWNGDYTCSGQLTTEESGQYPVYQHSTEANIPSSATSCPPHESLPTTAQVTPKELPIRFTQEMYDTLKDFCAPPPTGKER